MPKRGGAGCPVSRSRRVVISPYPVLSSLILSGPFGSSPYGVRWGGANLVPKQSRVSRRCGAGIPSCLAPLPRERRNGCHCDPPDSQSAVLASRPGSSIPTFNALYQGAPQFRAGTASMPSFELLCQGSRAGSAHASTHEGFSTRHSL